MSTEIKTQVVVLGAGPAGYSAAFRCADLGLETVIVERYSTLGGVCLNVGCIPSKALLDSSEHFEKAKHEFADFGIVINEPQVDLAKMIERKNAHCVIEVDGGVNVQNAQQLFDSGVNVLVAGSAVFNADNPIETIHNMLKS